MEDALAQLQVITLLNEAGEGLNPCCNGRCTRTQKRAMNEEILKMS